MVITDEEEDLILQRIKQDKMTPREKTIEIEEGRNWIVEFWRVRGFEIVKTALGISFTLHRKPEFENRGLGLDLTYLEQFAEESIKRREKKCYTIKKPKARRNLTGCENEREEY